MPKVKVAGKGPQYHIQHHMTVYINCAIVSFLNMKQLNYKNYLKYHVGDARFQHDKQHVQYDRLLSNIFENLTVTPEKRHQRYIFLN